MATISRRRIIIHRWIDRWPLTRHFDSVRKEFNGRIARNITMVGTIFGLGTIQTTKTERFSWYRDTNITSQHGGLELG